MPNSARRPGSLVCLVLVTAWLAPGRAHAQAATTTAPQAQQTANADAPRVRLVATGGTISNRTGGRLTAEELVKSMPGIERYARPEFEQF